MRTHLTPLALLAALFVSNDSVDAQRGAFPRSTASDQGISPHALGKLDRLIEGFVADGEIVGAELMVIVNNRTIHHRGFGWRDREAKQPMAPGGVFCVRSMTKPLVGTAAMMLIEDGKLSLDDRASKFLPAFEQGRLRDITVKQLLTHTSGLPLSLLLGKKLTDLDGLQAAAALATDADLQAAPGEKFIYSDQGTDTLAAILEVASGRPFADLLQERVLGPLGMRNSACLLEPKHRLREFMGPLYVGSAGAWQRLWDPTHPPLFPFMLGSQGLYSTLEDYGRFLAFWLRNGRSRQRRLLARNLVAEVLRPGSATFRGGSTGLPGAKSDYGRLMQLWLPTDPAEAKAGQLVAFGHSGSDGTFAWAFPRQKAIVLYFTQSRFNKTGPAVEQALGELLLDVPVGAPPPLPPLEPLLGYYAEDQHSRYQAIIRDGEYLALETPGRRTRRLVYLGDDQWKFKAKPGVTLTFERSDSGSVTAILIGDHREIRLESDADLPSADAIAQKVRRAHGMAALESAGPIRIRSEVQLPKLGMKGTSEELLAWPDRFRVDDKIGANSERYAFDGSRVRFSAASGPVTEAEGEQAARARTAHSLARFGDWHKWREKLRVIQRLHPERGDVWVVRAGDTSSTAPTLYVDVNTNHLVCIDTIATLGALGRVGQSLRFFDFTETAGMVLPHRTDCAIAHPAIRQVLTTVRSIDTNVTVSDAAFRLGDR